MSLAARDATHSNIFKAMKDIKVMKDDAAAVEKQSEQIKAHYTQYFKV